MPPLSVTVIERALFLFASLSLSLLPSLNPQLNRDLRAISIDRGRVLPKESIIIIIIVVVSVNR